ncbi:MAG TPA: aminomethyl-transferring glycine dehydrogenase subunit GcvPA [Acidisarcina sp.]|nr:aminomethyl-transferring glycine dehydrogenase subunit GcvPA [Acidisarcina sp.]
MPQQPTRPHPYIPNSNPAVQKRMLDEIGVEAIEELYQDIPERLRYTGEMQLPPALDSEAALRRHMERLLGQNQHCRHALSFLGAGCYQHFVPAVCDEVNARSEFLTAYAGEPYEDHGRFQALWEYTSMMGELLNMDVVNVPTYDGCQAAATSLRMAGRITGRRRLLVSHGINPDKLSHIRGYCRSDHSIEVIPYSADTGLLDRESLQSMLSKDVAAVYFDNPTYFGAIEEGQEIVDMAHACGALAVVGADPSSLGILKPPADYGADIVCGDIQCLGVHMQFGGGHGGFIATRDETKFVNQFPSRLFGIVPTSVEGEYGFGDVAYERTSFAQREKGVEFVGTAAALWGITAGVYLALMGPTGMRELGQGILHRSHYAAQRLSSIPGVRAPLYPSPFFKEFVVNFDDTGKSVSEINEELLKADIFGGKSLERDFPELGNSALFCVTEIHTKEDIDKLANVLSEVLEATCRI